MNSAICGVHYTFVQDFASVAFPAGVAKIVIDRKEEHFSNG